MKYPWQEAVLAAFAAPHQSLATKANAAERAITERLRDQPKPDGNEASALTDALNALHALMREVNRERQQKEQDSV